MKRNSTIVSVAAATGIVGATVIAAISLMQATITNGAESDTVTLAATSATTPVPSDLVFSPSPLPEIPVLTESISPTSKASKEVKSSFQSVNQVDRDYAIKAVVDATGGTVTGVETMTYKSVDAFAVTVKRTDGSVVTGFVKKSNGNIYEWAVAKNAPTSDPQPEIVNQIDRDYAIKAVVDATGGTVTGVETMTYKSVDAFAVTVKRTDGSVITGYVDRSSGDIYEWAVVKAAPAVAPVQQYQDDDEDDDDHDASYAGDKDHDDDEEDDRDNDDD
jgi:hypothetical protein